jgi:2-polyprenylphenol 6-hydroxylase
MTSDVLVVGAGPVGLTTALALIRAGFSVSVVDAQPGIPVAPSGPFELRVSAITRAAEALLTHVKVWDSMSEMRRQSFESMRVWDAGSSGELQFDAADIGEPHLGTMVENSALTSALVAVLSEFAAPQFSWRRGAVLESLHVEDDGVIARVSGEVMRAHLVVGADGADSKVRELRDLPTRRRDYQQAGLVATLRTQQPHLGTAWQRFLPTGPIALLPLPGDFSSIVWSTDPQDAAELVAMSTERFNAVVSEAFEYRFGEVVWSGERGQFPLRRVEAVNYVAPRTVLVGDAAHTIHPLAGQGLNLGLLDAAALAQVMADARAAGRNAFSRVTLRRYERWRKAHNLAVQNGMDALRWVYAQRQRAVRSARGMGMGVINTLTPARNMLTELASGVTGDLPAVCRGGRGY